MPLPLRRLIVEGDDPEDMSAAAVIHALQLPLSQFHAAAAALQPPAEHMLWRVPALLGLAECAALRRALDASEPSPCSKDSVVRSLTRSLPSAAHEPPPHRPLDPSQVDADRGRALSPSDCAGWPSRPSAHRADPRGA